MITFEQLLVNTQDVLTITGNSLLKIITEYFGDVDYLQTSESDNRDSIVTLIYAENISKSLVIILKRAVTLFDSSMALINTHSKSP